MNRTGLVISFAAFVVSGALLAVMGYRVVANFRDASAGAVGRGSASTADAEYQKLPPDGQGDWMEGFTLSERSGRTVEWKDLAGKVRVVSFFFSSCPANCLQQNMKVRDLQQTYAGQDVALVSITCDPDTDSPERLREYATKLDASPDQWLFLTGRLVYIRRVAGELFNVALDKQTHSERFIVCDKAGQIRGTFLWNKLDEMAQLRLLVDKLLAEEQGTEGAVAQAEGRSLVTAFEYLPHVNAALNTLATVLLISGYVQIKRRQENAHKWTMLACFGVSVLFLACYLTHHWYLKYVVKLPYGSHLFPAEYPVARTIYLAVLIPHVILAAMVPFLALATIYLGLADRRAAHRRLAKWTFPIWLYVSITGVIVYVMRYQLYPPH